MLSDSPQKLRATRAYLVFTVCFFTFAIGNGFYLAHERGYGAGWWDTKISHSCHSPGGPYYLPDKPISEQPCPAPNSTGLMARLPLGLKPVPVEPEKSAAVEAMEGKATKSILDIFVMDESTVVEVMQGKDKGLFWPILRDTFLIVTAFAFLFFLLWWWWWFMSNFGTF